VDILIATKNNDTAAGRQVCRRIQSRIITEVLPVGRALRAAGAAVAASRILVLAIAMEQQESRASTAAARAPRRGEAV